MGRRKKKNFLILLSGASVIFALLFLACWWYGYYPEWGKSINKVEKSQTYLLLLQRQNEDVVSISTDMLYDTLREESPKTSTEVLVSIYNLWNEGIKDAYQPYTQFRDVYRSCSLQELDEQKDFRSLIGYFLFDRNNAGKVLMKAYSKVPLSYTYQHDGKEHTTWDAGKVAYLEMILVQEEIQKHLTPWEKTHLRHLTDEKQTEKYSDPNYPLSLAKYNYLYTDACGFRNQDIYGEDYKENFGWLEEKLDEYAEPFEHLRLPICIALTSVSSIGDEVKIEMSF